MNAEELAAAVEELDTRLERLRVLYEQYFQGIEKIPPYIVQKDVDRRIWVLRREKIRNTGTRFRFQQIIQRYNTFSSYWVRIMREIENGTYKRDVLRAKKRFGIDASKPVPQPVREERISEPPQSVDLDLDDDDDLSDLGDLGPLPVGPPRLPPQRGVAPPLPARAAPAQPPAAQPPAPQPQPVAKPPARPTPSKSPPSPAVPAILASKVESDDDLDNMLDAALGVGGKPAPPVAAPKPAAPPPASPFAQPRPQPAPAQRLPTPAPAQRPPQAATPAKSGEDYRRVYAAFVEAKRRNGESTAGLTYETLVKSLKETTEKLKTKSGGRAIDYEVATKDGKTILKPVVR